MQLRGDHWFWNPAQLELIYRKKPFSVSTIKTALFEISCHLEKMARFNHFELCGVALRHYVQFTADGGLRTPGIFQGSTCVQKGAFWNSWLHDLVPAEDRAPIMAILLKSCRPLWTWIAQRPPLQYRTGRKQPRKEGNSRFDVLVGNKLTHMTSREELEIGSPLGTYLSSEIAARVETEALTATPCINGVTLHITAPNTQPENIHTDKMHMK